MTTQMTTLTSKELSKQKGTKNQTIQTENLHQIAILKALEKIQQDNGLYLDSDSILFNLMDNDEIEDYFYKMVQRYSLHEWHGGQTLKIQFSNTFSLENMTVKLMMKFLKKNFGNLTKLQITLANCNELGDKGVEYLSEIARHLPKLKELEMGFTGFYITGEGLKRLGSEISRQLIHLESFSLQFRSPTIMKHENIKMLFLGIGKYFSNLKRLKLEFDDVELKMKTVDYIASQIAKNFKGLEGFIFDIEEDNITLAKLGHLYKTLAFIPNFNLKAFQYRPEEDSD